VRETILRIINLADGIINTKLVLDLMTEYGPSTLNRKEVSKIIEELVEDGDIVRVNYVIPPKGKKKLVSGCLYLPKGSTAFISNENRY
jgi:hypothetical protein